MKFRDYFSIKHILFAVVILAVFIGLAVIDSNTQVKVTFEADAVLVNSDKYNMTIPYNMIASAELTDLQEAGEMVVNTRDDETIRSGRWKNDAWGEYDIIADLEAKNCIVVHLNDGRMFVFSIKDSAETEKTYDTLLRYLEMNT